MAKSLDHVPDAAASWPPFAGKGSLLATGDNVRYRPLVPSCLTFWPNLSRLLSFAGCAGWPDFVVESCGKRRKHGELALGGIESPHPIHPNPSPLPDPTSKMVHERNYELVDLRSLPPQECPCGVARRAFADRDDFPATVHLTAISKDAQTHYHLRQTEVYVIVQCDASAAMELDGQLRPVRPGMTVLIPPGVRHRAVGEMEVIIFCTPKFDPQDEYVDAC